jgi:hypothetical protein
MTNQLNDKWKQSVGKFSINLVINGNLQEDIEMFRTLNKTLNKDKV